MVDSVLEDSVASGPDRPSRGDDDRTQDGAFTSTIPGRLDRLPWSRWHWLVLVGLGTVWILDGLEVTIVGAVGSTLTSKGSGISITSAGIGYAAGTYVLGACLGALVFGHLTDRLGRKRLFLVTLGLYLASTMLTATSRDVWMFCAFRFLTGMGIGGEYAAINSAIDELIPARVRGTVDLIVNGSFWLGTAAGAAATLALLDPTLLAVDLGWRVCFLLGAVLGIAVLLVRRTLPESPRWLLTHGHADEAEEVVTEIERRVERSTGQELDDPGEPIEIKERPPAGVLEVAKVVFGTYPRRSVVGLSLFIGQAFLYNAVFFTFSLVLGTFYKVPSGSIGYYVIAFAVGNFMGPLVLGRLFDVVGRRVMIGGTYVLSGILLAVTAWLFDAGTLTALTQTIAWAVIFFFASAGASAAYLTVSEIFPMETRALAIAFFYAVGTGIGGVAGPSLFGNLVASKRPSEMACGYLLGAGLMIAAGVVEWTLGVDAERKSLEEVATPLSATGAGDDDGRPHATRGPGHEDKGRRDDDARPAPDHARRHDRAGERRGRHPVAPGRRPLTATLVTSPAPSSWARIPRVSSVTDDPSLARHVDELVAALEADGPLRIHQLASRTAHRYWGPGRFSAALTEALRSGRVRRVDARRFGVGEQADARGTAPT